VFDDLAVGVEAEDVDAGPVAVPITVARPLLVAMQDHVVAFGKHPLDDHVLAWKFLGHALEVGDEGLLAVGHQWVVLNVLGADKAPNRLGGFALVEHQVVEVDHGLLVALQLIGHRTSRKHVRNSAAIGAATSRRHADWTPAGHHLPSPNRD
jgi:hypothetical protein